MDNENKRVFFAFEAHSPWPKSLPKGRMLRETDRHLTVAFLGNIDWKKLEKLLPEVPVPNIHVGMVGEFSLPLFLPPHHPNVVAWEVKWWEEPLDLEAYQIELTDWLQTHGFPIRLHKGPFLPHVTLCRRPFHIDQWEKAFHPLPMYISHFHLYESVGNLNYLPIWTHPIQEPFTETTLFGESIDQLMLHKKAWSAYTNQTQTFNIKEINKNKTFYSCQIH